MDQLIFASLSHNHYWYEVGMLKVPAISMEMSRLTRDGTAEPVSRDQILTRERGQGNIIFVCSTDHEQDWQPYPLDPM